MQFVVWFAVALRECFQSSIIEEEVAIHSYYTVMRKSVKRSAVYCVSAVRRLAHRSIIALVTEAACWCTVGKVVVPSFSDLSHSKHLSSQSKNQ